MRFGRGTDEVDNLIVGVPRDVPPVDHHHLVSFVEFWIAPEGKKANVNMTGTRNLDISTELAQR